MKALEAARKEQKSARPHSDDLDQTLSVVAGTDSSLDGVSDSMAPVGALLAKVEVFTKIVDGIGEVRLFGRSFLL